LESERHVALLAPAPERENVDADSQRDRGIEGRKACSGSVRPTPRSSSLEGAKPRHSEGVRDLHGSTRLECDGANPSVSHAEEFRMLTVLSAVAIPLALGSPGQPHLDTQTAPTFKSPVRLMAGDALLGEDRLYPSPVFHDMNGDGLLDIVVGDLQGRLTLALQGKVDGARTFAAETEVEASDGKRLDFHHG
jgi:hypothetical protein